MSEIVRRGITFHFTDDEKWTEKAIDGMASAYRENYERMVHYMFCNGLSEAYPGISEEEVASALGDALIDLDIEQITYVNQGLDQIHIFSLEYSGMFETFAYFSIDG